jgi:hypothetical protein
MKVSASQRGNPLFDGQSDALSGQKEGEVRRARCLLACVTLCLMLGGTAILGASEQPPPDQTKDIVIVAPETGCIASVGDVLDVMVIVREGLEVASVAVLCDSRGAGMAQSAPYTVKWNTSDLEPGEHVLRAFAYLKSGDKVGAAPVVVSLIERRDKPATGAAASALTPVVLKEGSPVLLHTSDKMVSGQVAEGAAVRFKVARDVLGPEGKVLIAYSGHAQGRVTRSRRRGMFGKAGQLEFNVETATAVDGTTVPLRATQQMAGKDNKGTVIATALLLTVFTVFVNGKDVELPAGSEIAAYVDHDTEIRVPELAATVGVARGEPMESVVITKPVEGESIRTGRSLEIVVDATPASKVIGLRVFANGKEIAAQERELKPIVLNSNRLPAGACTLEAEAKYASGRVVRSEPVHVKIGGNE